MYPDIANVPIETIEKDYWKKCLSPEGNIIF